MYKCEFVITFTNVLVFRKRQHQYIMFSKIESDARARYECGGVAQELREAGACIPGRPEPSVQAVRSVFCVNDSCHIYDAACTNGGRRSLRKTIDSDLGFGIL